MKSMAGALGLWRSLPAIAMVPLFTLAVACDPPGSQSSGVPSIDGAASASSAQSAALPHQPDFAWQAIEPSEILSNGPPAQFNLSAGYVSIVYPLTAVEVGDQVSFSFTTAGAPGGLRVVLMRHCGTGSEMDSASEVYEIGPEPKEFSLSRIFTEAHPCLRVMFISRDSAPNKVDVWNWKLTPAVRAVRPEAAEPAAPVEQPPTSPTTKPANAPAPHAP
jgi:hypothetical protein